MSLPAKQSLVLCGVTYTIGFLLIITYFWLVSVCVTHLYGNKKSRNNTCWLYFLPLVILVTQQSIGYFFILLPGYIK